MGNLNLSEPSYITVVDDSSFSKDGLVLWLDASNWYSYPRSGTIWKNLVGNYHATINTTAYNNTGPKYMDFRGSYGCAKFISGDWSISPSTQTVTVIVWTRILNSTSDWRTLLRGLSVTNNHQVIIQSGAYNMGYFDNDTGAWFMSSGLDVRDIPGYSTNQWTMLTWRYNTTSPYYTITYNDTPHIIRGQITNSKSQWKNGICSIGAYNNGNQNNPSNASQYWGDISSIMIFRRILSDYEILGHFQARKNRFGL